MLYRSDFYVWECECGWDEMLISVREVWSFLIDLFSRHWGGVGQLISVYKNVTGLHRIDRMRCRDIFISMLLIGYWVFLFLMFFLSNRTRLKWNLFFFAKHSRFSWMAHERWKLIADIDWSNCLALSRKPFFSIQVNKDLFVFLTIDIIPANVKNVW